MSKVLYPGSFDPLTKGHTNIIEQATHIFEEVVIAVLINRSKNLPLFSPNERLQMISELYKDFSNIKVVKGEGTATELASLYGCRAILRGIRDTKDLEAEQKLAWATSRFSNDTIKTCILLPDSAYQFLSSSVVKEIHNVNEDISDLVDPVIYQKILERSA